MSVDNTFETPEQRLPAGMTLWEMHGWLSSRNIITPVVSEKSSGRMEKRWPHKRPSYTDFKIPEDEVTFFQAADMIEILETRRIVTEVEGRMMRARLLSLKDRVRKKVIDNAEALAAGKKRKAKDIRMVVSAVSSADSAIDSEEESISAEARRLAYKNRWSSAKKKKKTIRILSTRWTLERATQRYKRHLRKRQVTSPPTIDATSVVSLPPTKKRPVEKANDTECDADDEDDRPTSKRQRIADVVVPPVVPSKDAATNDDDIIVTSMTVGSSKKTSTIPSIVRTVAKTNTLLNFLSQNKPK